ncbi:MAG: UDP-N-acetylmuramoyl-tripeptide--D-alanyl-D-alanine ligase, partial [Flavobacteriaceae bacterium]
MTIDQLYPLFLQSSQVCTDTRKITDNCLFFALKGDNFDGNEYAMEALEKGAKYAVVDNGAHASHPRALLVEDSLRALQELATYHRQQCNAKIVALTGSNGKTTTKELIHAVLAKKYRTIATKGNLNNHIGVPLTLLTIQQDTEMAVVEMGANHKREIAFLCSIAQPDYGYITNFGKAHLEGFGSEEGVIEGKSELYDHLIAHKKSLFLNADDPIQQSRLGTYIHKYGFSQENHQYYIIKPRKGSAYVSLEAEGSLINTQLIGQYNFTNCCAAVLIGKYFNVALGAIKEALEGY